MLWTHVLFGGLGEGLLQQQTRTKEDELYTLPSRVPGGTVSRVLSRVLFLLRTRSSGFSNQTSISPRRRALGKDVMTCRSGRCASDLQGGRGTIQSFKHVQNDRHPHLLPSHSTIPIQSSPSNSSADTSQGWAPRLHPASLSWDMRGSRIPGGHTSPDAWP